MPQIFTNPSALEEKIDNVPLSDKQIIEAKRLKKKLDTWRRRRQSKIVAYVGRFGSGKSATLNHAESLYDQSRSKHKPLWLNFEAWRYTNREQLWEGFVIEVISKIKDKDDHAQTAQEIDGIIGPHRFVSRHPIWSALIIFVIGIALASLLWWCLYDNIDTISRWIMALLKYALPMLFVVATFFGISSLFQKKEPLKRVFELEKKLEAALYNDTEQPLIIIAEDIDRAGDEGVVFLETLRSFINKPREKPFSYPVIVVAPQDMTYMSVLNEDKIKGLERGIKIYDSVMYYNSSSIQGGDTTRLLDEAGVRPEYRDKIIEVAGGMLRLHKSDLSLRMLKFIFREAEEFAESQDNIDASLAILIVSMRYIRVNDGTMQDIFRGRRMLRKSSVSTNEARQSAIHLMYDQLLAISGLDPAENAPMYVSCKSIEEEITGEYIKHDPNNSNVKAGYYITIHERYKDLLS